MLIRKITIENVRSFLDRQEFLFDGPISILIGPNGGGKTNLLDSVVIMLRKYLFATRYEEQSYMNGNEPIYTLSANANLNQLSFEKHHLGNDKSQLVELVVQVSQSDLDNMRVMKNDSQEMLKLLSKKYDMNPWNQSDKWKIDNIVAGTQLTYVWADGHLQQPANVEANHFLQYLQLFEYDNQTRYELKRSTLQLPMVYLPVNRASGGFGSSVSLANYNDRDQKRAIDATSSRNNHNIISLAVGRLSKKYRALLEDSNVNAREAFESDPNLVALSQSLFELGYEWDLATIDPYTNTYDITLKKQGISFAVSAASSGERELLTYLFAIYALNVRDAVIVVDEPELHLHPKWQKKLFDLFVKLATETGNQFILATHSPTFISPASIQYVSRVFSENQRSKIVRLSCTGLPNSKHLFNIVNSQNNERIFFTDCVLLVEGISDRIFFERVFNIMEQMHGINRDNIEIISVGGKGLFNAYKQLLSACHVNSFIVADLDYIEQVGTGEVKSLFRLNAAEIKKDVIDNVSSMDGDSLVERIEEAISSGSWDDANETWQYIKSRRIKLAPNLGEQEKKLLSEFLQTKSNEGFFILNDGALENYLPVGYKSKDLDKFITFLESDNFWEELPSNKKEIENIAMRILSN